MHEYVLLHKIKNYQLTTNNMIKALEISHLYLQTLKTQPLTTNFYNVSGKL